MRRRAAMTARRLGLALTMLGAAISANGSGFELSGTVLDELGAGIPSAALTLTHEATGRSQTATSSAAGHYRFGALAPGAYTLEARSDGFATSRFAGLRYFADTKPVFNVTLRRRDVQESMTFTGEAPLINVSQAQVGLSVDERQLHELPLGRRDYLELVALAGGAHEVTESPPGAVSRGAPLLSISGASAQYTTYQLDGFHNTRDQHGVALVDVDVDAVEEFRVISGQFSAEYGRSVSGIVSATTSSGGNDYHADLYGNLRPGAWDADDPLTGESTALDRQEVGGVVSGRLSEERTQFLASISYRNQSDDVVVTAPYDDGRFRGVVELPSERVRLLAKITHQIGEDHQLAVKTAVSHRDAVEGVGGFDIADNALDTRNDDVAASATLVSTLGRAQSELRVGFAAERFRTSAGPPPEGAVAIHPTFGRIGNPLRTERADEDHFELSEVLSRSYAEHHVKAGFSYLRIASSSALERYGDGVSWFAPGDATRQVLFWQSVLTPDGLDRLERRESHLQVFASDEWQLSPFLTLNLGLRWEKETSVPDNDNLAPRIGLHWDASGDGRTSVRGGYGVFYGFVFSIVDSLERLYGPGGRAVVASATRSSDLDLPRNLYIDARVFAPQQRKSPASQHVSFGVERELRPLLSAALDVTYVRGRDLILPVDVNAPTSFDGAAGSTRSPADADRTRPFGAPGDPIPPGSDALLPGGFPAAGYRDLYLLSSRGRSRFWGVKLNVTRRYASDLSIQAVYQWSRSDNDGDDYRILESLPLDPARPDLEWGRSGTDIPHAFALNGVWDAPLDFRVSGLFRARSGRPVDPRVDEDLDGDLKLRERAFGSGTRFARNSFRLPATASLDLSLSRSWDLEEGRRLKASLDLFNVTNRLNPRQYLATYGAAEEPLATFLEIVQAGPPRQLQLSVRLSF